MLFAEPYEQQRLNEDARFTESTRQTRVMLLALLPIGAALATMLQFMDISATLDDADYYYVLDRPPLDVYARLFVPSLLAGLIATGGVVWLFTFVSESGSALWRMIVIGLMYGVLMPVLSGLLMPLNLFVLSVSGLSRVSNQGTLTDQLGDWVFDTPAHAYLGWLLGVPHAIVAGLIMAGLGWLVMRAAGPIGNPARALPISLLGLGVAAVIVGLMMVGPFGFFEYWFNQYTNQ